MSQEDEMRSSGVGSGAFPRILPGTKGLICTRCLAGCNGVHKNEKLNDVGKSKPHSDTATTKRDGDCMPMAMRNVGPPFIKKKNRVYSVY